MTKGDSPRSLGEPPSAHFRQRDDSLWKLESVRTNAAARHPRTKLDFEGANTTGGTDNVDLALTFTFERPNGTKV